MSLNENAQQVGYQLDLQLNNSIQDIYRYSHNCSHSQFKHHVLITVRKLIRCDSVHWATVVDVSDPQICSLYSEFKNITSSSVNTADISNYVATDSLNSDIEQLLSSLSNWTLGKSFVPRNTAANSGPNMSNQARKVANIQTTSDSNYHRLITIERSQQSQLHDIFVLQRNENQDNFSEDERTLNQHLVPHILEAYRINLLHNRLINDFSTRTAICDMKGNLLLSDQNFSLALSNLHTESNGNTIPLNVFRTLLENESLVYRKSKIIMKAHIIDDLMFINFLEDRRCGGLSSNERLVTKFMIQGLNHIDMAKQLKLPVSSILYIVNCVFKKLGIKNKAELNMKFSGAQANITMALES